ncbi:MAG TPA: hypothetical protein VF116_15710 [Ktedonobacterales bacterium]
MFEVLPVVIPTLRDVARGTLRPAEPPNDAAATAAARTAVILMDARSAGMPALGALYDELELYLQAANIASLRLHRRGESAVTQMFDILASVTLLRSHGCRRVILLVAAEGTFRSWEQSRAETLASLLDLVRLQHSGTARELIGAIADLVKTIRIVADSVAGVATILVPASSSHGPRVPHGAQATWQASAAAREASTQPARSPKALVLPLREGDGHVSAVSQLYLWCHALAGETPTVSHATKWTADEVLPTMALDRSAARIRLRAIGTEFHEALKWLDEQWSAIFDEMARQSPHAAAHILAAEAAHLQTTARQSCVVVGQTHLRIASRAAWKYLDASMRLKWLDMCHRAFAALGGSPAWEDPVAVIERVD